MSEFQFFMPTFKIAAKTPGEASKINAFITHILNHMPYETQLKAADKVNNAADPASKVKKIAKGIKFL